MSDKAYDVLQGALEAFEKYEFSSIAVVMTGGSCGKVTICHNAKHPFELLGALRVVEARLCERIFEEASEDKDLQCELPAEDNQ